MSNPSTHRSGAPSASADTTMSHTHDLSHDMSHDPTHNHGHHHDHSPRPPSSPLGSGLDLRLLIAAAAIGLLWLAVLWAVR